MLYKSDHVRNVEAMHLAARCGARTHHGDPCCGPAVKGKTLCYQHGGRGARAKTYKSKQRESQRTLTPHEQQLRKNIKNVERKIAKLKKTGWDEYEVERLGRIRDELLLLSQQRPEFIAECVTLPKKAQEEQARAAELAYIRQHEESTRRTPEAVRAKALGAMLGCAVGEAVGVTMEGQERDAGRELTDLWGGGILGVKRGEWASGTATMMALTESLIWCNGLNETDLMDRFTDWYENGEYSCTGTCVGIGDLTRNALIAYRHTKDPMAGDRDMECLGNGSLVRIAPVAVRYWNDLVELRYVAAHQCLTTHAGPGAVDSCVAFAEVLADAINCDKPDVVLRGRDLPHADTVNFIMKGSWQGLRRDKVRSDNNIMNSLEAAIWCVDQTNSFEKAVLLAANLCDDAGTTAALAGQLAGALYSAAGIPTAWLELLAQREHITEQFEALFAMARPFRPERE